MTTEKPFEKIEEGEKREGQIQDLVSGHWVKAGPEEVDAVQIFSRRLIEDYDYPKTYVQTRPQFRVRKRPYMAIIGDGRGGVFCENSLLPPKEWHHAAQDSIEIGSFDVVLTNPPFGTKIPIKGERVLSQFDLGYKWKKDKKTGDVEKTNTLHEDQPPQILFLERCLQFLKGTSNNRFLKVPSSFSAN